MVSVQQVVENIAGASSDELIQAHNELHAIWKSGDVEVEQAAKFNAIIRAVLIEKNIAPTVIDSDLDMRSAIWMEESSLFDVDSSPVHKILAGEKLQIEKGIGAQLWGSPAGKSNIAKRLLPMFPEHDAYTELFFGGGALFWGKEKVETEVVNDFDEEIAFAIKFTRDMTDADIEKLKKMNWNPISKEEWVRLFKSEPTDPLERYYRFLKVRVCSFMSRGLTFSPQHSGGKNIPKKLERAREKLSGVRVFNTSYADIIKQYDSPTAFHFLDPPYVKTDQGVGEKTFDHEQFWDILASLDGKWMVTYHMSPFDMFDGKFKGKDWTVVEMGHSRTRGTSGNGEYTTIVTMNYQPTEDQIKFCTTKPSDRQKVKKHEAEDNTDVLRWIPITKSDTTSGDAQIVMGVVLEPDGVDAHGDTISAQEIEDAAHQWLAKFQNAGLMHSRLVNEKVELYESYIAPVDFEIGSEQVKAGSWILVYHVLDSDLWAAIKSGELTGFSMGGFARRVDP